MQSRSTWLWTIALVCVAGLLAGCPDSSDTSGGAWGFGDAGAEEDEDERTDCDDGERSNEYYCCMEGDYLPQAVCEDGEWTCDIGELISDLSECEVQPPIVDAGGPGPVDAGRYCETDEDCPSGGCIHRRCNDDFDASFVTEGCGRNRNCPEGFICSGECVPDEDAGDASPGEVDCRRDRNCPEDEICLHGHCQSP